MKNLKIALVLLLSAFTTVLVAQTKINATVLLKPGSNNTFLYTNGSGAVVWTNAASALTEGVAIDITGNTVGVDPTGLTNLGATPATGDYFMVYDLDVTTLKRVNYSDILAGVTYTMSDGTNTQTLNVGNTLLFSSTGSDGYDFTVGATDQVTFSYDFTELTQIASVDAAADRILIYDASITAYRYALPNQIAGYSFVLSDGTNTQTIDNGNTFLFSDAANGIDPVVGATDQVTIDLDVNELTADASPDYAADYVLTYDASAGAEKKVLITNLSGGAENNVSIASDTPANTNIASGLTLSSYRYVQVFLDGVKQRQTTDWIISSNNIQFTFATNTGQIMTVVGFK